MEKNSPLLTVIVPVYNGSNYIKDAYTAILNQQIESVEIFFVDNNSTDDSVKIINEISNEDDKVFFFTEKKQGAAAARNKGFNYAKGKYIYFFDVDDILFPDALKSLIQVLEKKIDLDSVFGKCLRSSTREINHNFQKDISNRVDIKEPPYYGIKWFKQFASIQGTPAFLHRRSSLLKLNHKFNEGLKTGEDAFYHIILGLNCSIAFFDQYIFTYYRHENSTVSLQNEKATKVETYWKQLIKAYIPYYIENSTPREFNIVLYKKLFGMLPKISLQSLGLKKRLHTYKRLKKEMLPIKIPFMFEVFVYLILLTKSKTLYKVYNFYIIRKLIKN